MVLERLQRHQQEQMSAQLAEHQKREERLISTIMESNLRSTERFVSLMIDGLRTVLPPHFSSSPGPPAFTSFHPVHPPPMYGLHVPQATCIHSEEEESQFIFFFQQLCICCSVKGQKCYYSCTVSNVPCFVSM